MTREHLENDLLSDREVILIRPRNSIYGTLDRSSLDGLSREIDAAVAHEPPCDLILDLSQIEAFGSAFVNLLIETSRRLQARGARIAVWNDATGLIRQLGLDRVFSGQTRAASAERAAR